jgi:Immunity protein 45
MAKWIPLLLYSGDPLIRGTLFKFPRGYPFERNVVMMLCEAGGRLGLITITGYKAGIRPVVVFPEEALADGPGSGISPQWLVSNWKFHVWEDANLDDVLIRERLSADEL